MKPAPKLQMFILKLAATRSVDLNQTGAYLRLELAAGASWARLIIENIGAYRINIACQLYLYHDWVSDPELVLWIDEYGAWTPVEVTQVQGGWRCYAEVDPNGDLEVIFDPNGQTALADFAEEEVVLNLLEQGWFEQEVTVTTQRPAYTQEELLARGYVVEHPWLPEEDEHDVPF
jgi:hypothetical protein